MIAAAHGVAAFRPRLDMRAGVGPSPTGHNAAQHLPKFCAKRSSRDRYGGEPSETAAFAFELPGVPLYRLGGVHKD
jgi:hypothetical protein